MSVRYLLDTNVLSEPIRPNPDTGVMERIEAHRKRIATATPVWHELVFGCLRLPRSKRRSILEAYLFDRLRTSLVLLPYDDEAAEWHAAERARLQRRGITPPFVDGQIAAIALVNGFVLVTANVSDYKHFNDLRIEDWRART